MPATRSTRAKDKTPPGFTISKNTGPVKKHHQQTILQGDKDNTAPSNHATEPTGITEPKTRQRGRPRKPVVVPTDNSRDDNNEPQTANPGVAKCNRKQKDVQERTDDPPTKRTKVGDTEATPTESTKGRAQKRAQEYMPWDPLPDRQGRNVHPAGPPTTRRTSQEVAADREARKQALEEKIREGERAKQLFTQMSIAEEEFDEKMPSRNPQCLSAAIRKHGQDRLEEDVDNDEGEEFNFEEVDDGSSSESVVQPVQESKRKRVKKPPKGTIRKEIQAMTNELRGKGGSGIQDKGETAALATFNPSDAAPKKYQNAGLRKNATLKKAPEPIDPFQSGGLNDEDAYAVRPSSSRDLEHHGSRGHNLVAVMGGNSDNAHVAAVNSQTSQKAVKASKASKTPKATEERPNETSAANGAEFLGDVRWAKVFIPTITHAFYVSRQPFVDWTSESPALLATVQRAFNLSFPNVKFTLSANDPVVETAYQRVKSRKSKVASSVLEAVKRFFEKGGFPNQPQKIRDYVRWALKPDGAAHYQFPTPQSCKVNRDHADYIPPDGFLKSEFIAPIAEQFLGYAKNSVLVPVLDAKNPPKGLYTLILVAVERAFTVHLQGTYIQPPMFTHETCWRPLQVFYGHLDCLSERRWKLVPGLVSSGSNQESDQDPPADEMMMISAYRADLYIPLSPEKL